ncbi:MAG: DUF3106 domain-containing protein [Rhodanobacteraceae bacterium]|nr:MAG: DUF3106 domain-containing protein [Rhodanobacteraceae bacterium]
MRAALQTAASIALACLLVPAAAAAQTSTAIPMHSGPPATLPARPAPAPPLGWDRLSPAQQHALAPLRAQWSQLPPARQHRLAAHATHWATLPPGHQQLIRERLTRWANMTPAERRQLRDNARAFRNLPPAERAKVDAAFHRFQQLSPGERRALRQRFRALPRAQRLHWAAEHPEPPIPMHPAGTSGH